MENILPRGLNTRRDFRCTNGTQRTKWLQVHIRRCSFLHRAWPVYRSSAHMCKCIPNHIEQRVNSCLMEWIAFLCRAGLQLMILLTIDSSAHCFHNELINCFIYCIKRQKIILKNPHHSFPEPKVTSWNCWVCPTNNPKPKDSFTITGDKDTQQILTLKKLELIIGLSK